MSGVVSSIRRPATTVRQLWDRSVGPADGELAYASERPVDVVLRAGLALVTAVTFVSVALLAIVHVADRFEVNQVAGTWFAMAQDLHDGVLYRPLFENGYYGLSGYMPVQVVVNTAASFLTGEYLASAKVVAYASGLALVVLLCFLLVRAGCPRLLSLGLVSALLATHVGLVATLGIHGDTLPLVLQLAGLALVMHSRSRRAVVTAAVLCALAILTKFTAIWAPIAIALWLTFRFRRSLALFVATLVGTTLALVVLFEVVSGGRFSENITEVIGSGGNGSGGSVFAGISTFFELMVTRAGAIWLLFPFAIMAMLLAAGRRSFTLVELSWLCALPIVVVVLGDPGSDFNHLIDISALTVLVVGGLWQSASTGSRERTLMLSTLVCVAVILGTLQSYRVALKTEVAHAVRVAAGRTPTHYSTNPLAGVVGSDDSVLSEDPVIPILRDERPVVLDGFGLRRLGESHPSLLLDLERRLDDRAFDRVVLIHPVSDLDWYDEISMGSAVRTAIARNYALVAQVKAPPHEYYWVYAPKGSHDVP